MKQLTLLFFLFLIVPSIAQDELKITEEGRSMAQGSANALVMYIPKASSKLVKKHWGKYAKGFKGKLKYNGKVGEYFLDNAEIKTMSDNMLDVTAKIYDKGASGAELAVWFNFGITYLSSEAEPQRYAAAEVFLKDFHKLIEADLIKLQLKDEKKKLIKMKKAQKKLEKEKKAADKKVEKQKKAILKAEKLIDESEQKIEENLKKQEKQNEEISTQETLINDIKAKLKNTSK